MENRRAARRSVEYTGRNVEEAIRKASEVLGVPVSELEYVIVRDSTRSILGFVRTGEVTIRVSARAGGGERAEDEEAGLTEDLQPQAVLSDDEDYDEEDQGPQPGNIRTDRVSTELEDIATDVVSTLLDKMGALAAVEVVHRGGGADRDAGEETPLTLNIVGDDLGGLIGRRGETLRNLQFIVRLIVSRKTGVWPNLVIDVENYKAKREVALRALAKRMADQVRRTRETAVLEPMPAHERRIIHLALRDDPDVYTESTGEDEHRKVQIIPR